VSSVSHLGIILNGIYLYYAPGCTVRPFYPKVGIFSCFTYWRSNALDN